MTSQITISASKKKRPAHVDIYEGEFEFDVELASH
jgi:hypothetical protein